MPDSARSRPTEPLHRALGAHAHSHPSPTNCLLPSPPRGSTLKAVNLSTAATVNRRPRWLPPLLLALATAASLVVLAADWPGMGGMHDNSLRPNSETGLVPHGKAELMLDVRNSADYLQKIVTSAGAMTFVYVYLDASTLDDQVLGCTWTLKWPNPLGTAGTNGLTFLMPQFNPDGYALNGVTGGIVDFFNGYPKDLWRTYAGIGPNSSFVKGSTGPLQRKAIVGSYFALSNPGPDTLGTIEVLNAKVFTTAGEKPAQGSRYTILRKDQPSFYDLPPVLVQDTYGDIDSQISDTYVTAYKKHTVLDSAPTVTGPWTMMAGNNYGLCPGYGYFWSDIRMRKPASPTLEFFRTRSEP